MALNFWFFSQTISLYEPTYHGGAAILRNPGTVHIRIIIFIVIDLSINSFIQIPIIKVLKIILKTLKIKFFKKVKQ